MSPLDVASAANSFALLFIGDTTDYRWSSNGQEHSVRVPPFACTENDVVETEVLACLERNQPQLEEWVANTYRNDEIVLLTYTEAKRYACHKDSELIAAALRLHFGAIMSQGKSIDGQTPSSRHTGAG